MTGNKKQVIPWGSLLIKDPTSWMCAECIPDGFDWKDPSKIQVERSSVCLIIDVDCEDQGLETLLGCSLHHPLRTLTHHQRTCGPKPLAHMTQMRRYLFSQIVMSLVKRKMIIKCTKYQMMYLQLWVIC